MTTQEKFYKIDKSIVENQNCRVHFNQNLNRLPITGMFIHHIDYAELGNKRLVRFVTTAKIDNYKKTKSVYFTNILSVEDIWEIKPFVCPVII